MKYKVGDKVRIKSLDWYNENKDKDGNIPLIGNTNSEYNFIKIMRGLCGKVMTISSVNMYSYNMVEDNCEYFWTDEMIEGLVEEETKFGTASNPIEIKSNANCLTRERVDDTKPEPKFKVGDKIKLKSTLLNDIFGVIGYESEGYRITNISNGLTYFMSYSIEHYYELAEEETLIERVDDNGLPFNEWLSHKGAFYIPDGYELKDENGNVINATKIVLEKKSPKTDDIIKWLREHDMTKYIGVIYSGMCSITFDTEKLIKDITEMIGDE